MATRMLIDARHSEETRVAVLKGNRIEEFDFESAEHKQIKGNIYLAKVTRVEPSLQAAFVDFGGNRHGFLAFSEIHPDYYQIPREDREALLAEEAEAAEEEAALRAADEDEGNLPGGEYDAEDESSEALVEDLAEDGLEEIDTSEKDSVSTIEEGQLDGDDDDDSDDEDDDSESEGDSDDDNSNRRGGRGRGRGQKGRRQGGGGKPSRAKAVDEARAKRMALRRRYKIQDVIQRRQVLLVQVVKEERGNKGAALTTYLSLAGRYTVLMPNSSHGGGISRKISSSGDRKRLKDIVSDLTLPKNMGLIVRTAGLSRTKPEIKRDFDYLARVWDEIRDRTLGSSAPALIHSDSDLIKRAIRDIYNREIEEVVVEGEGGYKAAKEFMKLLMPSHARRVKAYSDPVPLFQRYGAEDQLRAMYDPVVQLKSGGYLVINPTEALVSIDINSGRSTKEHGIEATATATNLEAAREIARQLRLRDMAGLVVIDFIDMEYNNNVRKVERAMKDALKHDRARIQVGRISSFGLMEMSRQRLRTGVLEATTRDCPHCDGTGLVRTASSAGLSALRLIEDEAAKGRGTVITLTASTEAAVYMLNSKRADLSEIENRYHVTVEVMPGSEDEGAKMAVGSSGPRPTEAPTFEPIVIEDDDDDVVEDDYADEDDNDDRGSGRGRNSGRNDNDDDDGENRPRRRRRGGRGRKRSGGDNQNSENQNGDSQNDNRDEAPDNRSDNRPDSRPENGQEHASNDDDGEDKPKKRRRRGGRRRRGRGRSEGEDGAENAVEGSENLSEVSKQMQDDIAVVAGPDGAPQSADTAAEDKPKPRSRGGSRAKKTGTEASASEAETASADDKPKPVRRARSRKKVEEATPSDTAPAADDASADKPKRRSRAKKADVSASDGDAPAEAKPAKAKPEAKAAPKPRAKPAAKTVSKTAVPKTAAPKTAAPKTAAKASEAAPAEEGDSAGSRKSGWWQRTFG